MPDFEIIAGEGIPPIRFGMTLDEVRAVMGEPDSSGPGVLEYFSGVLLVNADSEGRVNYLEVSPFRDVRVLYKGVSVFEVPPAEAARLAGGPMDADDLESFDVEADVGLSRCDEDGGWDSIGVGAGQHFARLR